MTISQHRRRALWLAAASILPALVASARAAPPDQPCAIVLMHGKWGDTRYIGFMGRRMEPYCVVRNIELPWSRRRAYDVPYPQALQEIAEQVAELRAAGFARVVLMGHSFGANAALAYMAQYGDADAVVALAPGHAPAVMYARGIGREAVEQARALVAAGKGDETLSMEDFNQGQSQHLRMRADVLLSYFDPDGLGHMPATAAAFRRPVPLLWVIGTADPFYRAGEAYAYSRAPPHPASRYLVYTGGHGDYEASADQVLQWLQALP